MARATEKLAKDLEKQVQSDRKMGSKPVSAERPTDRARDRRLILAGALSVASVGLGIGTAAVAGLVS